MWNKKSSLPGLKAGQFYLLWVSFIKYAAAFGKNAFLYFKLIDLCLAACFVAGLPCEYKQDACMKMTDYYWQLLVASLTSQTLSVPQHDTESDWRCGTERVWLAATVCTWVLILTHSTQKPPLPHVLSSHCFMCREESSHQPGNC